MPNRNEKRWNLSRIVMSLLRCFLAVMYLWAMASAAALIPVPHQTQSKWLFWITSVQYSLTYTSLMPFDYFLQGYVLLAVVQVLYRLFLFCRRHFFGYVDDHDKIQYDKASFDRRLILHFGPYCIFFILNWLASMFFIYMTVLWLYHHQVTRKETCLFCELALVIIFKMIVLSNAIVRTVRGLIILKIFNAEPEGYLRNGYNFGEHLKLFFQL